MAAADFNLNARAATASHRDHQLPLLLRQQQHHHHSPAPAAARAAAAAAALAAQQSRLLDDRRISSSVVFSALLSYGSGDHPAASPSAAAATTGGCSRFGNGSAGEGWPMGATWPQYLVCASSSGHVAWHRFSTVLAQLRLQQLQQQQQQQQQQQEQGGMVDVSEDGRRQACTKGWQAAAMHQGHVSSHADDHVNVHGTVPGSHGKHFTNRPSAAAAAAAGRGDGDKAAWWVADAHASRTCASRLSSASDLVGCRYGAMATSLPTVQPDLVVRAHTGPVYGLLDFSPYGHPSAAPAIGHSGGGLPALLFSCGDDGAIRGWRWRDVEEAMAAGRDTLASDVSCLELRNPHHPVAGAAGCFSVPETNAMDIVADGVACPTLFSAAGDNVAYAWDIEKQQQKMVLRGHTAYLHCISAVPSLSLVATGSEDATVRLWDVRSGRCVSVLEPWHAKPCVSAAEAAMASAAGQGTTSTSAAQVGQASSTPPWVGAVAATHNGNWLYAGTGGGVVSAYSLRAPQPSAVVRFSASASPVLSLCAEDDSHVLVGVADDARGVSRWSLDGRCVSHMPTPAHAVYSIQANSPCQLWALGGGGGVVDVVSSYGTHVAAFRTAAAAAVGVSVC